VSDVEKQIDRLFGLPLDEFTGARNDLARRLKEDGHADEATAVQALPKPTVAAWTVNQLARGDAAGVRELLDAGDALRSAQGRLLAGQDASDSLREATAQERDAVRALTVRAEAILQDAGRPASQAMLERVAATLRAAAVDNEGRRLLEAGRLTAELDPAGFGGLAAAPTTAGRRKPRARAQKPSAADKRRERDEEQRRRQELRQQARELERDARAAERAAEKAEAAAEQARRRAEQARADADAASAAATS
jgi:hypothetical protein